ncbi:MAG: ribosome maturation factor [Spirochaetales bacterium]
MEYTSLEKQQYYTEIAALAESLGYLIVDLHIVQDASSFKVSVVIVHMPSDDSGSQGIGIRDCTTIHRLLLPVFEDRLYPNDVYMEVTSPGMGRVIKNAAEFACFIGHQLQVWDTMTENWISGILLTANTESLTLKLLQNDEEKTLSYEHIKKAKLLYTEG